MSFDCCEGAHLELCSNSVSAGSILYSLGRKDYSLTEQSGKHVNNLVGLHSACTLWHTHTNQDNAVYCAVHETKPEASMCTTITCSPLSYTLKDTDTHTLRGVILAEKYHCTHQQGFREQL